MRGLVAVALALAVCGAEAGRRHNRVHRPPLAATIPGHGALETVFVDGAYNFVGLYNYVVTARIFLSWVPQAYSIAALQPVFLITDPYLNFFRRLPLQIGGLDLSAIPALLLLSFGQGAIATLGAELPANVMKSLPSSKDVFAKLPLLEDAPKRRGLPSLLGNSGLVGRFQDLSRH